MLVNTVWINGNCREHSVMTLKSPGFLWHRCVKPCHGFLVRHMDNRVSKPYLYDLKNHILLWEKRKFLYSLEKVMCPVRRLNLKHCSPSFSNKEAAPWLSHGHRQSHRSTSLSLLFSYSCGFILLLFSGFPLDTLIVCMVISIKYPLFKICRNILKTL